MLTVMLMQTTKCPKIIVKQVKDMAESFRRSSSVLFSSLGKTATLEYRISVLTNCMLPICYDIVGSTVSQLVHCIRISVLHQNSGGFGSSTVERFPDGKHRNTSRVWWSTDTMFNVSNGCEQAMLCQCKIRVQGITRRLSPPLAQRTELMNYTALHLRATKRSKFKFITMQGNPVYLCPINYNHKINSKIRNSTQPFVEDLTTMIIMQHQCKRSCANSAVQEVETQYTLVQWSAEGRGRAKRFSALGGSGTEAECAG